MKTVLIVIGVVVVAAIGAIVALAGGFSREIARAEARLQGYVPEAVRPDLPPAVQAYAERGMAGGKPGAAAELVQAAEMRLKRGADWTGLAARQTISMPVPGFAWVAAMQIGPVAVVRVIDRYVEGAGLLEVRALGAVPMGRETGPDAAIGEGLRYLAELPWAPDAILTNREIIWRETDDGVAARMETAGGPAEVEFRFDAAGDIVGMVAKARPAKLEDGTLVRLDWHGTFSDYALIGGRRIPRAGDVGYDYPDGFELYFRGTITGYRVIGAAP